MPGMEEFLDALAAFLHTNVTTTPPIEWIIGDPGMSAPTTLPVGYIAPLWDTVKPYSAGVDMDAYAIPILIIDDLHKYGPPVANANASGTFEQPGYRILQELAQSTSAALRSGGKGITVGGEAATTAVKAIKFVWVTIDKKPYRGAQIALTVEQRTFWPTI